MSEATVINFPGTADPALGVIGATQLLPVAEAEVLTRLVSFDDFADPWHATIWAAIVRLIDRGEQPCPITIVQAIRDAGEITEANKLQHVSATTVQAYERCPHPRSVLRYAAAVIEDKYRREVRKFGERIDQIADLQPIDALDAQIGLWLDDIRDAHRRMTHARSEMLGGAK